MRKNSGFTAFELAVSMAIMAVIAALVLPPYQQWLRGHRLRGAVTNLMGDIEMAKIRAIRENDFVVVSFEQNSYTIFLDKTPNWDPGGETIIKTRKLPAGVQFDLDELVFAEDFPNSIDDATRFNGRGLPSNVPSETEIPLYNQSQSSSIFINRLGHMRVD
jgi:prepilin-type N-terminal cleavage/methylation domain-containing protein